ncbi:MAG: N-acetyltransferase [Dechloromonas sp.]|nr:MAG: N-acetyltransferase [Dechloromonas sp.]
MRKPLIRNERPADRAAIRALTQAAFAGHPHSQQTEHFIVDALRQAHALTVSLVAEVEGAVVGHVAFSPVVIGDGSPGWYGVGPLSVLPARQGRGIGRELMHQGLQRLRMLGAAGCVLVGEPAYYGHFGFGRDAGLWLADVPAEYFLALTLAGPAAHGEVRFHPAFAADESPPRG